MSAVSACGTQTLLISFLGKELPGSTGDRELKCSGRGLALLLDLGYTEEKSASFPGSPNSAWLLLVLTVLSSSIQQAMLRSKCPLLFQPFESINENNERPP